ncbi:MAG: flagellar hook protein [Butyrivibrio sp.]|nr:flagellar hook protein [Butyrivibrio sp.]
MINNSSSQKYLLKKNYKSNADLKSEINNSSIGTTVKITNGTTTSGYTVQNYNYIDVKSYVSSAKVGAGTSATTSVSITAGGSASSYKLRNYNMQSVKALVAGYEYPEDTVKGIIIKVDGNAYTAETEFYRSKLCIAYGEDNQTNVKAEGASNDDPISSKSIVTFHGKTYTLLLDENFDGYDDDDDSIVTEGRAYKIIAKELARASSIGATESSAVVRDKHNVDIVDDVTMAADFLVDPDSDSSAVRFEIDRGVTQIAKELRLNIHAGTDADMNNKIGINIKAMSARGLGIEGLNVSDDNGIAATYAIDAIEDAIMEVSKTRSLLGAAQNRLEHTIKNLDNVVENTTAAESRIRDTDMPDEMVEFSKNNILAQAGQAMLAQANQTPQGVMALLGG